MNISVIGLGKIGKEIALHLLAAGHHVIVWNRSAGGLDGMQERGAQVAATAGEAFQNDIVVSVLFDDSAIETTLFPDGLLTGKPKLHICMASISIARARTIAAIHADAGVDYVAAPFFGRPEAARAQQLNILLGGPPQAVSRAGDILTPLGTSWIMGSEPMAANMGKLAGNFLMGGLIEAMAESAALLRSSKIDPAPIFTMLGKTLLAAPIFNAYIKAVTAFESGGIPIGLDLPIKDTQAAISVAERCNLRLPIAELNLESLLRGKAMGMGSEDGAVVRAKLAEKRNIR